MRRRPPAAYDSCSLGPSFSFHRSVPTRRGHTGCSGARCAPTRVIIEWRASRHRCRAGSCGLPGFGWRAPLPFCWSPMCCARFCPENGGWAAFRAAPVAARCIWRGRLPIRPCPECRSSRPDRCRRRRPALPFQADTRCSRCGRRNRRPEWSDCAAAGLRTVVPRSAVVEVDPRTAARHCGRPPVPRRGGPRGRSQQSPLAAVRTSFDAPSRRVANIPARCRVANRAGARHDSCAARQHRFNRRAMPIAEADRKRIVQAIRSYIARERISRGEFAERTKLGKSTVDKLVVGLFSEKTILQIESQLKISLVGGGGPGETAAEELGRYTKEETQNYVGDYVFARPSFHEDGLIYAFHMEVLWDREASALLVREAARGKQTPLQFGKIYIPRASMHLFILSNEHGWLKKVILSQLDVYKRMKGIMLTMGHAFGNLYTPVAMPVIMNRYDKIDSQMVGKIERASRVYQEYNRDLLAVEEEQFAKWIRIKPA